MHIWMCEAPLRDIESRVQGAGGVQGELVLLRVYVELHDCALPTLHPKHSNARGALIRVRVRVRVREGDYFLRLHTPFSIVGLAR